jgi:hypothetical protein
LLILGKTGDDLTDKKEADHARQNPDHLLQHLLAIAFRSLLDMATQVEVPIVDVRIAARPQLIWLG